MSEVFDYTTDPERVGHDAMAVDILGKRGAPGASKRGLTRSSCGWRI
ncbi:hypothetical protein [Atopobium sp. oral taxon 416]|nr:hypothetical protein [Atopobium sp. oral taxon 416]